MKNKEMQILRGMNDIEDRFLEEAANYGTGRVRMTRMSRILVAAVVAVMILSVTAVAANTTWRENIRSWLGIGAEGAAGYAEQATVVTGDIGSAELLSEFCSGYEMYVYFSVKPEEQYHNADLWYVQYQSEAFWQDTDMSRFTLVSSSEDEMLFQLALTNRNLKEYSEIGFKLYYYDEENGTEAEFLPEMSVPVIETETLCITPELTIRNALADDEATITEVRLSEGNLVLRIQHEYIERWCDRVCAPDRGKAFMESYTGETWVPEEPEQDPDVELVFSFHDEQAIFAAYQDTWNRTIWETVMPEIKVYLTDGTILTPAERVEPVSVDLGDTGYDTDEFCWKLDRVIDLEQVSRIEIGGNVYDLSVE